MANKSVMTPEMILSYPRIFEPGQTLSGELKYGCSLIAAPGQDLAALKAAAMAVAEERWGAKAKQMLAGKRLRWPFRDGAEKTGPGYGPGKVFLNVTSNQQPGVVDRYAGPDGKPRVITDPSEIYPGCRVRALITPFAYDVNGNKGISFALDALQKLGEGERIDGRVAAQDAFDALETAPAELETADDLLRVS